MAKITLQTAYLKGIAQFASKKDKYMKKENTYGVRIAQHGNQVTLTATDGHRLVTALTGSVEGKFEAFTLDVDLSAFKARKFTSHEITIDTESQKITRIDGITIAYEPLPQPYADWTRAFKGNLTSYNKPIPAKINPSLLEAFTFLDGWQIYMPDEPTKPLLLTAKNQDIQAHALLMPMRTDRQEYDMIPSWL